ncbi:MAG TPA: cell division protein FtsZ, partial [Aeromonas salmonicida]|nr:cell division protein FtsZ [Aeromonas salmonicida]
DVDMAIPDADLVNDAASMDITIEEFETVGNAVKARACENATVVVGTGIDPEGHDELRVTVVATGIGAERKPDITLVKNNMVQERPARQPLISEALQSRVMEEAPAKVVNAEPQARREPDYLDIPAFLRKQAD